MAKTNPKPAATQNRLFVLALGLLVGFVLAFVFVLSRVPVDGIIGHNGNATEHGADVANMDFDYYSVLQDQEAARRPAPRVVAVEPPVIFMEPPTSIQQNPQRVTPQAVPQVRQRSPQVVQNSASTPSPAQSRPATQPQVKEILASEKGQDAYYVEAGNYRINEEALQVQSSLRSLGLDAFIVVRQDNSGVFGHRVRIGPFFEQSNLDDTRNRLRSGGIKPKLIRVKG